MQNVLLLTFANDEGKILSYLEKEQIGVLKALEPNEERGYYKLDIISKQEELNDRLLTHGDRLRLFLYSGHADEENLQTEGDATFVKGLAATLGKCKNLKVAILNGCRTKGLVDALHNAGVPLVIATTRKVGDLAATRFSIQFFNALTKGKTVKESFEHGIDAAETVKLEKNEKGEYNTLKIHRGTVLLEDEQDDVVCVYSITSHPTDLAKAAEALEWKLVDTSPATEDTLVSTPTIFKSKFVLFRLFWRLMPWLDFHKGYWAVLKNGPREITKAELLQIFKHYIVPSQFKFAGLTMFARSTGAKDVQKLLEKWRQDLLALFKGGFLKAETGNYVLLLADSGMGKTTFLQKLFYKHARRYPKENLAFVYAGRRTALWVERIENKQNTILFLDALDEDFAAQNDLTAALLRLSPTLLAFKKVFMTARIQLFLNREQEWTNLIYDQDRDIQLYNITMFQFTTEEAKKYLEIKYKRDLGQKEKALRILMENSDFFRRPLLLTWIDYIIYGQGSAEPIRFAYLYQVFEIMVKEWCRREALTSHTEQINQQEDTLKEMEPLMEFSQAGAIHLFHSSQETFTANDIAHITLQGAEIKFRDARGRSFLKRNPEDDSYAFTHYSFFSYFLALSLLEGRVTEEEFNFEAYPEASAFYEDMCWDKFAGLEQRPIDPGNRPIRLEDNANLITYFEMEGWRSDLILIIPHLIIRALLVRCGDRLDKFEEEPHWFQIIGWLQMQCNDLDLEPYVFQYYETFLKAVKEDADLDYHNAPAMVQRFLAEYTYDDVLKQFQVLQTDNPDFFALEADPEIYLSMLPNAYPVQDFGRTLMKVLDNVYFRQKHQTHTKWKTTGLCIENTQFLPLLSKNLVELNLCKNRLRELSGAHLPLGLEKLNLSQNEFTQLPESITLLENLYSLDISFNKLNELSDFKLPFGLHILNLENNELRNLPDYMKLLVALEELNINYNKLPEIPSVILYLKQLRHLYLANNRITAGKQGLKPLLEMPELRSLILLGNPLVDVDPVWVHDVPVDKALDTDPIFPSLGPEAWVEDFFIQNDIITRNCLRSLRNQILIPPEMVEVKGGLFVMGDNNGGLGERPEHIVSLSDFAIGKYLVTQGEFCLFLKEMGYNSQKKNSFYFDGLEFEYFDSQFYRQPFDKYGKPNYNDRLPIRYVGFDAIVKFCNWASKKWGYKPVYFRSFHAFGSLYLDPHADGYRLPTEAEWEYAARGGQIGLKDNYKYAGSNDLREVGWFDKEIYKGEKNDCHTLIPVGMKKPNQLGLYDMSGNILEYCEDIYDVDYYRHCLESGFVKNPLMGISNEHGKMGGAPVRSQRVWRLHQGWEAVYRGGACFFSESECSVTRRYKGNEEKNEDWNVMLGFRLARSL